MFSPFVSKVNLFWRPEKGCVYIHSTSHVRSTFSYISGTYVLFASLDRLAFKNRFPKSYESEKCRNKFLIAFKNFFKSSFTKSVCTGLSLANQRWRQKIHRGIDLKSVFYDTNRTYYVWCSPRPTFYIWIWTSKNWNLSLCFSLFIVH